MKVNNEITVKIKGDIESFKSNLERNGYKETGHFVLYDTFMIPENLEIEKLSTREIISKAIIIRKVDDIAKKEIRQDISFKFKKYDENGDILEQKSTRLKVLDCQEAENFMKVIGYKKLMNITEEDYDYQKGNIFLTTKDVHDGDKMIEAETQESNPNFNSIEKIKETLKAENLPLDFTDCFIKKAEVQLNKILNRF